MAVKIRAAAPGDCERLLAMIRDHAAYERAEATISLARLKALLAERWPPVSRRVAESSGELLGHAALTIDFA